MFTQEMIEAAFSRLVRNGDLTVIARAFRHSEQYIQAKFDPAKPNHVSDLYRAIVTFRAWIGNDYARGSRALALFNHFASVDTKEQLCMKSETLKLKKEVDDWETASMCGKSLDVLESETLDIHFQAGQTLRSIARAKNQADR